MSINRCGHSPANPTPFFSGKVGAPSLFGFGSVFVWLRLCLAPSWLHIRLIPSLFGSRLGLLHSEKRTGGNTLRAVNVALIDVMIFCYA